MKRDLSLARMFAIYDPFCAHSVTDATVRMRTINTTTYSCDYGNGVRIELFHPDETFEDYETACASTGERIC